MNLTAAEYRRQAMRWGDEAQKASDPGQRDRLMKMRDAFLTLAENEDWLAGRRRPDTNAPAPERRVG
jgi:hypothetical protein